MMTLSQVADALAKLHRDAGNIESTLKSARVEMTSLVARIRRDVPNAPDEPAGWGYAAIAVGFALPCKSTAEFTKKVFGPFRKALSGVVSKAV